MKRNFLIPSANWHGGMGTRGLLPTSPVVPCPAPLTFSPAAPASVLAPSSKPPDPQVLFCSLPLILFHLEKEVVQDHSPWALRGVGADVLGSTGLCWAHPGPPCPGSAMLPSTLSPRLPPPPLGSVHAHLLLIFLESRPTQALL